MGLLDFFKKEKTIKNNFEELFVIIFLRDIVTLDLFNIIENFRNDWKCNTSIKNDETILVDDEEFEIIYFQEPVPWTYLEDSAKNALNWETFDEDYKNHSSHIFVRLKSIKLRLPESFKIFTKLITSMLLTTNSIGVWVSYSGLLITRKQFLSSSEALKTGLLPFELCVYVGLRKNDKGNSVYSYGLKYFGKLEMEFINSDIELENLYDIMGTMCNHVINNNIKFKNGEVLETTPEIKLTQSKGIFLEGHTLKMALSKK